MQSVIHLKQGTFDLFPPVYAVQNDTGRTLKMIVDDVTFSNTDTGNLYFRRSDGSYYNVTTTFDSNDNSFEADITQALTQPGITQCQLKVTDTNDLVVSTYTFVIMVQLSADGVPTEQLGVSPEELIAAAAQLTLSDNDVKLALLQIAEKTAYIDQHGQDYYDALEDALYPPVRATSVSLDKNSLGFTGIGGTDTLVATVSPNNVEDDTVYWGSSDKSVAVVSDGVVIATGFGSATITAICGTVHASASVTVATATLLSITAVYTQSGDVYDTDTLDSLKTDLVVTAYYDDNTSVIVPDTDYTLSGSLTTGTSTITVSYGGKTDTFSVTVTHDDRPLYPLTDYATTNASVTNGYQFSWTYTGSTSYNKFYANINDGNYAISTTNAQLDNKPTWFTLHAGDSVTITLSNIVNAKNKSFSFALRKANSTTTLADVSIANGVHTGSVTATGTITADVDISKIFIYEQSGSIGANTTIGFDINITVNGTRYV